MPVLANTELDMHPLVLGTNIFGWTADEASSLHILDLFADQGGTLVDTADAYSYWVPGHTGRESETVIGKWLARPGNRERLRVGTKVGMYPAFEGLSGSNVRAAIDASLRALRTDHVDIYWAHFDDPDTPLEETVEAFDAVVREGKARHIGISNFDAERVDAWMEIATRHHLTTPVALQPHYNLVKRQPFEGQLQPLAARWGLAVIPYFGLASGFLTGKFRTLEQIERSSRAEITADYYSEEGLAVVAEATSIAEAHGVSTAAVALAWLLSRDTVAGPIASARTPEQLAELMVIDELKLTADELASLDAVSAHVPR